jgi:hypothetical protein
VILADGSSQGEMMVTEHDCAQEDTANDAIDKAAAGE